MTPKTLKRCIDWAGKNQIRIEFGVHPRTNEPLVAIYHRGQFMEFGENRTYTQLLVTLISRLANA